MGFYSLHCSKFRYRTRNLNVPKTHVGEPDFGCTRTCTIHHVVAARDFVVPGCGCLRKTRPNRACLTASELGCCLNLPVKENTNHTPRRCDIHRRHMNGICEHGVVAVLCATLRSRPLANHLACGWVGHIFPCGIQDLMHSKHGVPPAFQTNHDDTWGLAKMV